MTRSEILRADQGLAFIHPLVQRAVYESIPPARRSEQHRHAARLAAQAGAPPDAVAAHLFKAFPGSDPWAASRLREAATLAAQRAAPDMALTCLRRALDEAPPPALRSEIITDLGLIEARLQDPHAVEHLTIALGATNEPGRIADLAGALGRALGLEGRLPEAIDAIEQAIARLPSSYASLRMRLEGDIQAIGRTHPATVARADVRLERLTSDPSIPAVADALPGLLAQRAAWRATARWEETQRLAELALGDGRLLRTVGPEAPAYWTKVQALAWCDQYAIAVTHADAGLEAAQRMGSVVGYVLGCTYRAEIFYRQGRIRECEGDAEAALEAIDEHRMTLPGALSLAWHANALVDQGRLADAWASLASRGLGRGIPTQNVFAMALHARALLQMTAGHADAARRDALAAGDLLAPLGRAPTPLPWRATAALAAYTLGDHDQAQRLATTDLELATKYGAPRALGIALRTLALVQHPQPDVDLLRQSVSTLEHAQARAELARSLIALGATLRRRRDITASRVPLREGLDIATDCGATGLAGRAREELIASGAKPRNARLTGRDALTPRERRVVDLTARGMTNKQIAQELFLTVRTVETHLYRAYRKLGTSRAGLRNGQPTD